MRTIATNIRSANRFKNRVASGKIKLSKDDRALFNELLLLLNFYIDTDERTTEHLLETMVIWSMRQLFALQAEEDTEIDEFFIKNFIAKKVDSILNSNPKEQIKRLSDEVSMHRFTQSGELEDLHLDLTNTFHTLAKDIINYKRNENDYRVAGSRG